MHPLTPIPKRVLVLCGAGLLVAACFEPDTLKQRGLGAPTWLGDGLAMADGFDGHGGFDSADGSGAPGDLGADVSGVGDDGSDDGGASCGELRLCPEVGKRACDVTTGTLSECVQHAALPCQYWEAVDCDDGDPCTATSCDATGGGGCLAIPLRTASCVSVPPCEPGPCDASASVDALGGCVITPKADGSPCDDGDACTGQSSCSSGECQAGPPLTCDDGDACTTDSCDGGCQHSVLSCDDGNICTADVCDPAMGCTYVATNVGEPCNDGDVCTQVDVCTGGECVGSAPLGCDDGSACTADVCDPELGCVFAAIDTCGDGRCNCGEDHDACPLDCSAPGTCGDGVCEPGIGENSCNCWPDCETLTTSTPAPGEPASGSCSGMCGGQSSAGDCFCDAQCEAYGDCCQDKEAVCGCVSP